MRDRSSELSSLDILLHAVRRRAVFARLTNAAMVGAGVTSVVLFVDALWMPSDARWVTRGLAIALPVLFATIAGGLSRPSRHAVALRVDTSMGLSELLSSADAVRHHVDAASRSLVATANGVAATIDPRRVPVGFPRGDVVVALLTILSLSGLASLMRQPAEQSADAQPVAFNVPTSVQSDSPEKRTAAGQSPSIAAAPSGVESRDRESVRSMREADTTNNASRQAVQTTRDAGETASGTQQGQTRDAVTIDDPRFTLPRGRIMTTSEQQGAAGVDGVDSHGAGQALPAQTARERLAVSPASFEAMRDVARTQMASGRVPDRCRDLVRAYFDLDEADGQDDR